MRHVVRLVLAVLALAFAAPIGAQETKSTTGDPAAPILLSPAPFSTHSPGNIALDWTDVSGAKSYHVQVDDFNTFLTPVKNEEGITVSNSSTGYLSCGYYWWRVRAKDDDSYGPWSEVRTFRIPEPPPPPWLLIDYGKVLRPSSLPKDKLPIFTIRF